MTRKSPFFITASLLVATLALFLPDLDLETAAEEPVVGATMHCMPGPQPASSSAEETP